MKKPAFSFNFDLKEKLESIVGITSYVPENSFSADLLGTERTGHGIVIGDDDLIVTIGYLIIEAETIWISTGDKEAVPGYIVGNDYESGLALIKPMSPLNLPRIDCGNLDTLAPDDPVIIAGHGGLGYMMESRVTEIKEFAGRWEYILEKAIYTSPVHPNWAGAALIGEDGKLHGIGCLLIQDMASSDKVSGQNMFVPIDSITPVLNEIVANGARNQRPRPWLGLLVQEEEGQLIVSGIFTGCPADKAGLKLGDRITAVNTIPVSGLADFFRRVWGLGESGTEVPLTIVRDEIEKHVLVKSSDRDTCFRRGPIN